MSVEVFSRTEQGFAVHGLRTPRAELEMVPALGGRVISLRSQRTGREWCWHQPRPDWLWANQPGDDFGRSPQAGIDECLPTVGACTVDGRALPDHGEVWAQAWAFDTAELASARLTATAVAAASGLEFQRTIRVEADGRFVFDYSLRNTAAVARAWLWSLHPLFTIEPGDRLELPAEIRRWRLNGGLGDRPIAFGDEWSHPEPFPGFRLDRLETPGMPQGCVKGFAGPLAEGRAGLANSRTGDALELTWSPADNPWLGLWLNRGHAGFHHVALEPCSGAPDALSDALGAWQAAPSALAPGETRHWSLRWRIS